MLPSLSTDPLHTLILLNNLAEAGFLTESLYNVQGGRWRQALTTTIGELFATTVSSDLYLVANRRVMGQLLHLLPAMSSEGAGMVARVVDIINGLTGDNASRHEVETEWETAGPWNKSHLLAVALEAAEAFSTRDDVRSTLREQLLDSGKLFEIAERWSWNREVMGQVASFVELWADMIG